MMHQAALALPGLHLSIPMQMVIPGNTTMIAPLAIALLEANLITDAMLAPRPNMTLAQVFAHPDERALSADALSTWWSSLQYEAKFFNWQLHVQELHDSWVHRDDDNEIAWFCLTRDQNGSIPRLALRRRITELEATLEGFGQTVLAVLRDTFFRLPDALDPWRAADCAEWMHWKDSADDEELLETEREERGYATVQEVLDDGILTRAEFFKNMPRWVVYPQRVVSRDEIAAAACSDFERDVIAACDAISQFVMSPEFALKPHQVGSHQYGSDSVDGCIVLLWTENDQISRALDDALDMFGESGEYHQFIDARPVKPTGKDIRRNQVRTAQMMRLAELAERLLELIGDPI